MYSATSRSSWRRFQMIVRSRSSRRIEPIQRSAKVLATGFRTGVLRILKPSVLVGGRPRQRAGGWVQCLVTRFRCQRSRVSGVTNQPWRSGQFGDDDLARRSGLSGGNDIQQGVLTDPLGPRSTTNWPGSTRKETSTIGVDACRSDGRQSSRASGAIIGAGLRRWGSESAVAEVWPLSRR